MSEKSFVAALQEDAGARVRVSWSVALLAASIITILALRIAWVCDDAFITLRTVDNFVHGYGLRWNVAERVQSFTHPLWMFVVSAAYLLTAEPFFTTISVCLLVTFCAMLVAARRIATGILALAAGSLALIASRTFVEYSTSGLENCLTHLLLAIFFGAYFHSFRERTQKGAIVCWLSAAACILNRQDLGLLLLPAVIYLAWTWRPRMQTAVAIGIGAIPVVLWFGFSLVYYGYLFPNTAYAKLNTGIPTSELLTQGFLYFITTLGVDPVLIVLILLSPFLAYATKERSCWPVLFGIWLSLIYIVRVGGDFMLGRFFTPAFFAAVCLLLRVRWGRLPELWSWYAAMAALGIGGFVAAPYSSLSTELEGKYPIYEMFQSGIADERSYYPQLHLSSYNFATGGVPNQRAVIEALGDRERGAKVVEKGNVGLYGYYAGPEIYVVDSVALTDPFLARLPVFKGRSWRIGHYGRPIPAGYIRTLGTGKNELVSKPLAELYDHMKLITRGDLFTRERWAAIWELNSGQYNSLSEEYLPRQTVALDAVTSVTRGDSGYPANTLPIPHGGLTVTLGGMRKAAKLEAVLPAASSFELEFRAGEKSLKRVTWDGDGLTTEPVLRRIDVPRAARESGFDSVTIYPRTGDQRFFVRGMKLRE